MGQLEVKSQRNRFHHLWRNFSHMEKALDTRREMKLEPRLQSTTDLIFTARLMGMFTNLFIDHL